MTGTDSPAHSWKVYGLRLLNWCYVSIPFIPELLNLNSKVQGLIHAWHLISRNGVQGDYLEFGVFQGDTFKLAIKTSRNSFSSSPLKEYQGRFFAFDSFSGLPAVPSLSDHRNVFAAGEYTCSKEQFMKRLGRFGRKPNVHIIEGWFQDSLTSKMANDFQLNKAAIVNIDCDLYESTLTCLEFVTPFLQDGTVLLFDDWYIMGGSMRKGEPQAANEWLARNPQIQLFPLRNYGFAGQIFIVNLGENDSPFYLKSSGNKIDPSTNALKFGEAKGLHN